MKLGLQRLVNSLAWIICGVLVIVIRTVILQDAYTLAWEALGLVMMAYGMVKLLLMIARSVPEKPSAL